MQLVQSKIDDKGRITIPRPLRQELNIEEGGTVDITLSMGSLVIKPSSPRCVFCNKITKNKLLTRFVCPECVVEINEQ